MYTNYKHYQNNQDYYCSSYYTSKDVLSFTHAAPPNLGKISLSVILLSFFPTRTKRMKKIIVADMFTTGKLSTMAKVIRFKRSIASAGSEKARLTYSVVPKN
jgi:hypothetical protein